MSNIVSLFFYFAAFSVAALFYYKGNQENIRIYTAVALAIPIVISGFRYGVGSDFYGYLSTYYKFSTFSIADFYVVDGVRQIGFYLLNRLAFLLFDSYIALFTVFAFFTVLFFHKAIKKMNIQHPALLYFMYLLLVYPTSFNIMKQSLAISICTYAFYYLMSDDIKKYIGWIVVASFFHSSALILIPLFFVRKFFNIKKLTNLPITFIVGFSCTGLMFYATEVISFFNKYISYEEYNGDINNYSFYLKVFIYFALLLFGKQLIRKDENMVAFHLLTISIVASFLGFQSPFISRIGYYFSVFEIILLVNLVEIFKRRESKIIVYLGLIVYAFSFFIISYYILGQSRVIPYQTIFSI